MHLRSVNIQKVVRIKRSALATDHKPSRATLPFVVHILMLCSNMEDPA